MKWQDATPEEIDIINEYLKREEVNLDVIAPFKRFARRRSEHDKLVRFETGVTLRLMKFRKGFAQEVLIFYEPTEELFTDFTFFQLISACGADALEVIESTFLHAIRRHHRRQNNGDDSDTFGIF